MPVYRRVLQRIRFDEELTGYTYRLSSIARRPEKLSRFAYRLGVDEIVAYPFLCCAATSASFFDILIEAVLELHTCKDHIGVSLRVCYLYVRLCLYKAIVISSVFL